MAAPAKSFVFGPFHLDLGQKLLLRDGKPVPLAPKAILILCILVENHGKLVERDELMRCVWPNVFVEEGNLTVNIFALRKLLSQGLNGATVIETIPRRGYRFVAPVEEITGVGSGESGVGAGVTLATRIGDPGANVGFLPRPQLPTPHSHGKSVPAWVFGVAVAITIAMALIAWEFLAPSAPPRVSHVVQLTHFGMASAVATDGARLYVAEEKGGLSSIIQVPLEGGDPVPLPTPFRNTLLLDVSPRRSELLVASFAVRGDPMLVWILPLVGGSPRRLGDVVSDSAKWSPDGTKIAFQADGKVDVVNSDGSNVRELADRGDIVNSWSPDGRLIRFTRTNGAKGGMSLWEVQSDGTHLRPFLPERQSPAARWGEGQNLGLWTPDGKYFLFREAFGARVGIWAMAEKRGFLQFRRPQPVEIYAAGFDIDSMVIDPSGWRMFLVARDETQEIVRYDPGRRQFVPMSPALPGAPLWSPDRQWVGYTTPDSCLWKARPNGSERIQLTFPPMQAFSAGWSPDGKRLAFHGLSPGQPGKICLISAEGGRVETLFANEPTGENVPNWSPDGNTLMYQRTWLDKDGNTTRSAICVLDMKSNRVSELPGSENIGPPTWSPDGRYVAAQSGDFRELMLFDFRSRHWTVIAHGGFVNAPCWSHDGRYLYYQDSAGGEDQPIYRVPVPGGKVEEVASRKQFLRADVSRYRFARLDPDDRPLAVLIRRNGDVYALDLSQPE